MANNVFVKRMFPLMTGTLTDAENRMKVELVKVEFIAKVIFQLRCAEFRDFAVLSEK